MMRKRRGIDSQNLDSLLDTMANVVGILVVILAVTQLSVGEAMKRIRAIEDNAAAEFARALGRSVEIDHEMTALASKLESIDAPAAADNRAALERALAELRANPEIADLQEGSDAIATALARESRRAQRLSREVATGTAKLASLRVSLANLPDAGTAKTVRLPDPRPAPRGTVPAVFFCRYGRIFSVDLENLETKINEAMTQTARRVDFPMIGSDELRWIPFPDLKGARLAWRKPGVGESEGEIVEAASAYRQALGGLHPRRETIRYYVWSDSYDVYLRARSIAEDAGFQAGWMAFAEGRELDYLRSHNLVAEPAIPID